MFSSFTKFFKSAPKNTNNSTNTTTQKEEELSEQDTQERTGSNISEKDEEKMRFRLAMDIFKLEDSTKTNYDITCW